MSLLTDPRFAVPKAGAIRLADFATHLKDKPDKDDLKKTVAEERERIVDLQEKLYVDDRHALLLIFQAMDASGKDSCAKHVFNGEDGRHDRAARKLARQCPMHHGVGRLGPVRQPA